MHDAPTRRKTAVEGDPPGLLHRLARCSLLAGCGHLLPSAENALGISLPTEALETVAIPLASTSCGRRDTFILLCILPAKPVSARLARARKRHYTFARRQRSRHRGRWVARRQRNPKTLIYRVYLCFGSKAKRRCRGRVGRGEAGVFAPFVYRLGRHPFTVERAVRFR